MKDKLVRTYLLLKVPWLKCVYVHELQPLQHGPCLRLRLDHVGEDDVLLEALHLLSALIPGQRLVHPVGAEPLVVLVVVHLKYGQLL